MDFNTFVQEGYEVFVEGSGPQGWSKRRLDVVARWKAMGVTADSVTKYAVENTAFSGDYTSLVKVMSAYELYASVKLTAVDGILNFVPDSNVGGGGGGLDPAVQELLKAQQETMQALAAEVSRLSVASSGPAKPKAPELSKEALEEFTKLEGRPAWMLSQTGLLTAYLDEAVEENIDDNARAKSGMTLAKSVWQGMWESQQEYAAKYKKGTTTSTPATSSAPPVSSAGMAVARTEGGVSIFVRDGKEYWVSRKGTWLEVATIPHQPCTRCAGHGLTARHWFFQCPYWS